MVGLSEQLTAIASLQRMRIIDALRQQPLHVSELARRVGMSRALLYVHLAKLEQAGFVSGQLQLSPDGKALKLFEVRPFSITVDADALSAEVRSHERNDQ
jgi:predicted transcriptional regulator